MYFIYCFYLDKCELLIFFYDVKGSWVCCLTKNLQLALFSLLFLNFHYWLRIFHTEAHLKTCNTLTKDHCQDEIKCALNLWSLTRRQIITLSYSWTFWNLNHKQWIWEAMLLNINAAWESDLSVINVLIIFIQWLQKSQYNIHELSAELSSWNS